MSIFSLRDTAGMLPHPSVSNSDQDFRGRPVFYQWHQPLFHQRVQADDAIADALGEVRRGEQLQRFGQIDPAYLAIRRDDLLLLHDRCIQHQLHRGHGNADLQEPPACAIVSGTPLASMATSTPRPPVNSPIAATGSSTRASIWENAPSLLAAASLLSSTSMVMTLCPPAA